MESLIRTPALVTVVSLSPYGGVESERFEVPYDMRPVWLNPELVYSVERWSAGFSIRDIMRSAPVDLATWLHRSGLWDQMPADR